MNAKEKFMLFVATYATSLGNLKETLSHARKIPVVLIQGNEEERAYEFVAWYVGAHPKPVWMPKSVDEAPVLLSDYSAITGYDPSQAIDASTTNEAKEKFKNQPRRWRRGEEHGCYFPGTDLNVGQMGGRGTGAPKGVEWLDPVDDLPWVHT